MKTACGNSLRLCSGTHELSELYKSGEIGRSLSDYEAEIPASFLLEMPSAPRLYAEAIRQIALNAPIRMLPGERLAGAATLRKAMWHVIPGLKDIQLSGSGVQGLCFAGNNVGSISHTTIDFEKIVRVGYKGLRAEIEERLSRGGLDSDGVDLLNAMLSCVESAGLWHCRHVEELERLSARRDDAESANYRSVLSGLLSVPENPPCNFREAIQSLWLIWDFQRLCGNWSGIGRFDKMLGPFLKRDLESGEITLDGARELIAHFWIKGCEWITAEGVGTGDAQFYQNIVLGGVDEAGVELTNEVTYLVLDVVEELHISDFPIAVRISSKTPERLLRRTAEVQRLGGGIVAVYNEDLIIPSMVKFGYPLEEARNFANDGCWELLIPGKTRFSYQPIDTLQLLQDTLGLSNPDSTVNFDSFEELYDDFRLRLASATLLAVNSFQQPSTQPTVLIDMLVDGCIEKGLSYYNLGPKYSVVSPHAGGLPDVANSLLVIKRIVYERNEMPLEKLVGILREDWAGNEDLRLRLRSTPDFYGNDSSEGDAMLKRVFDDFTGLVGKVRLRNGILRPAGISTFGREVSAFLPNRLATASGSRKGDVLASNFTPSPGTDRRGPTAVIKSHCAVDFSRLPCGTALDLKLLPSSLQGEHGISSLVSMLKAFVSLGGIFMQIDAVDSELLRDAQAHPERHPGLAVRVSGWSARFATLERKWQDMIINRSQHKV